MPEEQREREIGIFKFGLDLCRAKKYLIGQHRTRSCWVFAYRNNCENLYICLFFDQSFVAYSDDKDHLSAEKLLSLVSNKASAFYDPEIEEVFIFNMHTLRRLREF